MRATSYDQIYSLKVPLELALQTILMAATALPWFTKLDALKFSPDDDALPLEERRPGFQHVRPRGSIMVSVRGREPRGHFHLIDNGDAGQFKHVDIYLVLISLSVVTELNEENLASGIHENNCARVRLAMTQNMIIEDEELLPYHVMDECLPEETDYNMTEEGLEISNLKYSAVLIVRDDAWFEPATT